MKIKCIIIACLLAVNVWAGTYRVHYSISGSGHDVTVQAETSGEARETVQNMFPGAVVTNVRKEKTK